MTAIHHNPTGAPDLPIIAALVGELGGHIVSTENGAVLVLPDGGVIYAGFTGAIRLQRYGKVIETLGTMSDGPTSIATKCRELMAVA